MPKNRKHKKGKKNLVAAAVVVVEVVAVVVEVFLFHMFQKNPKLNRVQNQIQVQSLYQNK